jgi:hypothetical protein
MGQCKFYSRGIRNLAWRETITGLFTVQKRYYFSKLEEKKTNEEDREGNGQTVEK